ncbi:hypothetical protein RJ640_006320 [Escallonia rubra]|uniref:Uncharacterized protein n=1 Tax=Escallonia rubra TaxID=112253 RepID=A0AA88UI38_9ASTE|nr:hypothetical protein RJ640_006320 [Escallonia rubra]
MRAFRIYIRRKQAVLFFCGVSWREKGIIEEEEFPGKFWCIFSRLGRLWPTSELRRSVSGRKRDTIRRHLISELKITGGQSTIMDRSTNNNNNGQNRDGLLLKTALHHQSETRSPATTSSPDFVLQWGNRKRLRCMKVQIKDNAAKKISSSNVPAGPAPVHRATVRIDRRVVRSDHKDPAPSAAVSNGNGYPNLRQRQSSPAPPRILRNTENSIGMKGHSNGVKGLCSPDRGVGGHDKKGTAHNNSTTNHATAHNNNNNNCNNNHNNIINSNGGGGGSVSSEAAKGGSSSGSEAIPAVWPPKFVIALTNKEKEEDFMAIKGSKLPQRPKKRAKFIQRTLNLVSPGSWLCDLTLERYEVREKKISKKRPRGLKAMGNMESDSE